MEECWRFSLYLPRSATKIVSPSTLSEESDGNIYFVADTSALISNYHGLVGNLKSAPECTDWKSGERLKPVVVIPWIVLCEMDKLKEYKYRTSLIVDHLLEFQFNPLFRFETLREFKDSQKWGRQLSLDSNDDKVLQTCLYFGQLVNAQKGKGTVILLTDDHMLKLRAQVIGIRALGSGEVPNSNVELLTAYCESMILGPVFKEQVLKSMPIKTNNKKRSKTKSKKAKSKANAKKAQNNNDRSNNRGKEACRNIYNAVQVALNHITAETHESAAYNAATSPSRRGQKYGTWTPSFHQLLAETGLLKKVLGNSTARWYEWCSGRVELISDFLVLACLGRLYENSLLACVPDGAPMPTHEEDFTTFGALLLDAYFHDGHPTEQPIEGLMQDTTIIKKVFSSPRDWYAWSANRACGPYTSESVQEWATMKLLSRDSKLLSRDVGCKASLKEGDFKTYAEYLVDVYCSGRIDPEKAKEEDAPHAEQDDVAEPAPAVAEYLRDSNSEFEVLSRNVKLVQAALGASAYWYYLFEQKEGNTICGPYRGGEIMQYVLDCQVPSNFRLHGTGEGEFVPITEQEFKSFHNVLLDTHHKWLHCA